MMLPGAQGQKLTQSLAGVDQGRLGVYKNCVGDNIVGG
jgi:hypothetical protein